VLFRSGNCLDCLEISKSASCQWNGDSCVGADLGGIPVRCETVYSNNNNNDQTTISGNTGAALFFEKAADSGVGHVVIVVAVIGGLFLLRKRGLCNRGKKSGNTYEAINNSSPSSVISRDFSFPKGASDVFGNRGNNPGSNSYFSETIPLSKQHSNSSADEEWGWEEGTSHVEMAGVPMSNNFRGGGNLHSSSREEEDLRLAMALSVSESEQRSNDQFSSISNGSVRSYTTEAPSLNIPTPITSFGPKAPTTVVSKPKPIRQEDDIFATLGLSAKPTFGASSSSSSFPKQNNNASVFNSPSPVSFALSSAVVMPSTTAFPQKSSIGSSNRAYPAPTYSNSKESDAQSLHSGGAADWGEDDDLDDLLND